ncbi:hypothetical protein [Pantoea ananatis]|uniref:hypothetical protein n=1 Tax=Pantoea ananas TaxID=553 RepID=UPI00188ED264|nr:hypothetical protein [Pantoea ananatis]
MKTTVPEMRGLLKGLCLPADIRFGEYLPEYLVRKFDEMHQKLDDLTVSWNIVRESGEPDLPIGDSKSFWVCYRSNGDNELRVSQAVWFNQPKPEDDDAECELYTPDGEPYWPVGWHEAYCHEDFSTYYLGWDCGQILAYADLKFPQIPVQLLSGTHDTADKAG